MSAIDQIKEKVSVSQLAETLGYYAVPAHGNCRSPFRHERSESFSVHTGDTRWKDHGADIGGDVVDFYRHHAGLGDSPDDYRAAVSALSKLLGIKDDGRDHLPVIRTKAPPRSTMTHADPKRSDQIPFSEFRDQALERFRTGPIDPAIKTYFDRKGIAPEVVWEAHEEGLLGITEAGELTYLYEHGAKIRHDIESSKSVRWEYGAAKGNLWGGHLLRGPAEVAVITEGESDRLKLLSSRSHRGHCVVGSPGASWRPDEVLSYAIGTRRKTVLAGDYDQPNPNTGKRAGEQFVLNVAKQIYTHASKPEIYAFSWRAAAAQGLAFNPMGRYDLCDLENSFIENIFDKCLIPLNNYLENQS